MPDLTPQSATPTAMPTTGSALGTPNQPVATPSTPIPTPQQATQQPVNAQNLTPAQMSAYAGQLADQQATQAKQSAIDAAVAARPQGTVYDPKTGFYSDPLTPGSSFLGYATGQLDSQGKEILSQTPVGGTGSARFSAPVSTYSVNNPHPIVTNPSSFNVATPDQRQALSSATQPVTTGFLTPDTANNALGAASSVLQNAQNNPLPSAQDAGLTTDPTTQAVGSILNAQLEYASSIVSDPTKDAVYQSLAAAQQQLNRAAEQQKGDIQAQADQQYTIQQQTNKESQARMEVAMAESGLTGSPLAVQYINDLTQQNVQALNSIRQAENSAIVQLNTAIAQQNVQLAIEQANRIDQNRQNYTSLALQTSQFQQQAQQAQQNRVLFQQQVKSNFKQDQLENFTIASQANADPSIFSPADYQSFEQAFNLQQGGGQAFYTAMRTAQQSQTQLQNQQVQAQAMQATMQTLQYLPQGQQMTVNIGGKPTTFTGSYIPGQENWSQSIQQMTDPKSGQPAYYSVVTDKQGNVIKSTLIGDKGIAPHYDSDTGQWVQYDPSTNSNTTVWNNGQYGEGTAGFSIASQYIDSLGAKVTQEPGGNFSHQNLTGWDLSVPAGTDVKPPDIQGIVVKTNDFNQNIAPQTDASGKVTNATGTPNDYGNFVDIMDMNTGSVFRFAHLSSIGVKAGQQVNGTSVLGQSGNTGLSSSAHLHFELRTANDQPVIPNRNAPGASQPVDLATATSPALQQTQVQAQRDLSQYIAEGNQFSVKAFQSWKAKKVKADDATVRDIESRIEKPQEIAGFSERKVAAQKFSAAYTSLQKGSPAPGIDDKVLVSAFIQMTHPNPKSIVRASESQALDQTVGVPDGLKRTLSQVLSGASLTSSQRNEMLNIVSQQYSSYQQEANDQISNAVKTSIIRGVNPQKLVLPITPKSIYFQTPDGQKMTTTDYLNPDLQNAVATGQLNVGVDF